MKADNSNFQRGSQSLGKEPQMQAERAGRWISSVLLLASFLGILASAYTFIAGNGSKLQTTGLLIGAALLILPITIRQFIILRENGKLLAELTRNSKQIEENTTDIARLTKERTHDLEVRTAMLRKLRWVGEISQVSASVRNLEGLLAQYAEKILERFNLTCTSIYLMDNDQEFLLPAFSARRKDEPIIANDHQFHVKDKGNISHTAATGEPFLFFVTQSDVNPANTHLLPDTRSEMALPLKIEDQTIGVLSLQSDRPQAFNEEDIVIRQIMADQLATAIERVRLLEQLENSLNDLEQAYGQFTREGWKTLGETGLLSQTGYRFDNVRIQPISQIPESGTEVLKSGEAVMQSSNGTSKSQVVAIPIKLRGQTIGVVSADLKEGDNPATVTTLQLAIERLALSLESARLYEEARLRADREQSIGHVTSSISSSTEYDEILQTTVREVGRLMADTEVTIQILSDMDNSKSGL